MAECDSSALTAAQLRELLSYDPESGKLLRIKSRAHWVGKEAGMLDAYGYVVVKIGKKAHKAHRLAWLYVHGEWPAGQIDHINGDKSDNRIANLRVVSNQANVQNVRRARSSNVSTRLLGAHYDKRNRVYLSRIWVGGKLVYLGRFDNAQDAHDAYLKAKREMHAGSTV